MFSHCAVQARILTIAPELLDYANSVAAEMKKNGIRVEVMSGMMPSPFTLFV